MSEQSDLFGPDKPLIYVASPLTGLAPKDRHTLDAWCKVIEDALYWAANHAVWDVRLHTALRHTPPWKRNDLTPDDIYNLNSGKVREADGLILLAFEGGSLGAGMELEWAAATGAPMLILLPKEENVSRQVTGAAEYLDLTIKKFNDADHLADLVRDWLTGRRADIQSQALRRALRQQRSLRLIVSMAARWQAASPEQRLEISVLAGRSEARIARLVSDIDALLGCSLAELEDVTSALGVELGAKLAAPSASLEIAQLRGLQQAAREYDWAADTVVELVVRAQAELLTGAVRRLPLTSVDDWLRFKKARLG